jgi:hypothetical protein
MYFEIRDGGALEFTARTRMRVGLVRMFRIHMLFHCLFLEEGLVTIFTFIGKHTLVFLEMVMHRILVLISHGAILALIESLCIFFVGQLCSHFRICKVMFQDKIFYAMFFNFFDFSIGVREGLNPHYRK